MSKIVPTNSDTWLFWCPGCDEVHQVDKRWEIDTQTNTLGGSVLVTGPGVCHSFVKNGTIQFLGDCTHKLVNQTVPLPDWPYGE